MSSPVFHLILQSEFPINALILTTEALRIANQNSGETLFEYSLVSHDGQDVRASNGMWITVNQRLKDLHHSDYVFIFEGNLPTQKNSPKLLAKLRELYRQGATLVGVDTGGFALTQAGVTSNPVVVHWEAASTYQERFTQLPISNQLYQIEDRIISCAGGVSTLDLTLTLIARHYGDGLAMEIANALVHTRREAWQEQRTDMQDIGDNQSLSDRMLKLMEQHMDFPLNADELAKKLGISISTLERHCHQHFDNTPMKIYLGLRLQAARNFLFYQDYRVKDVALAYGFNSTSVFSRTFKSYFGQSPSTFRKTLRDKQTETQLPEIKRLYTTPRH